MRPPEHSAPAERASLFRHTWSDHGTGLQRPSSNRTLDSASNFAASSNGPITARRIPSLPITSWATRSTSVGRHRIEAREHLRRLGRAPLEHLAAKSEHDQAVRALGLQDEPPLRERARLLELLGGHRLLREPPELGRDHVDRLFGAMQVDARLGEERARVGERRVDCVDVVRKTATLANLEEESGRHPGAEHGAEQLQRVAIRMVDRIARDAETDVRLVGVLAMQANLRLGGPVDLRGDRRSGAVAREVAEQPSSVGRRSSPTIPDTPTTMRCGVYQ